MLPPSPPRWCRLLLALPILCVGMAQGAVPKATEAEEIALKAIDEVRASEPGLPRVDVLPIAVAVGEGPISLTLQRALEIALANNSNLQTRRERVKIDAQELAAVRRGYGPQWRASVTAARRELGYTREDFRTTDQYTDSNPDHRRLPEASFRRGDFSRCGRFLFRAG